MASLSDTQPVALSHREVLIILGGVMVGMLLAALDQTIVATALPAMAAELGGAQNLSWVVSAYLVASTAATPIYGKLSDFYGRKLMLQAAILIFLATSLLCALAQTMGQLIAFRALQGLGGGGLLAMAHATIADIIAPRERGRYQGYIGAMFATASVAGPVLGGLFVEHLSWRWVFWINLPLGLLALAVSNRALAKLTVRGVRHSIDYLGAALLVGTVVGLLMATILVGGGLPVWSAEVLELGGLTAVLLVLFVWRELKAAEPILPLRLFANPVFAVANISSALVAMTMLGSLTLMPLFLQLVMGVSAEGAGLQMIPLTLAIPVAAITSGRLITRTGRYKIFPLAGLLLMGTALLLLATGDLASGGWYVSAVMALFGCGIGFNMPVVLVAIQNAVETRDLGTATASVSFFRSLGGSVGVALFTAVLVGGLDRRLLAEAGELGAFPGKAILEHGAEGLATLAAPLRGIVTAAAGASFQDVFLTATIITGAALLTTILLRELPLRSSR